MRFTRLRTASLSWSGRFNYESAALAIVAAGVGGLYALALTQMVAPNLANLSPQAVILEAGPPAPHVAGRTHTPVAPAKLPTNPEQPAAGGATLLDLDAVRAGDGAVPRLVVANLPDELPVIRDVAARKASFFSAVLPLILLVNEEIMAERTRLSALHDKSLSAEPLSLAENNWLDRLAEKYKVETGDFAALLMRVDTVSPGLTLAQAAEESGWGRSRFALEGNALFGQRTWVRGAGIVPAGRGAGQTYEVRAFATLLESVRAYAFNLNTQSNYAELRELRATMRGAGGLDPLALATALAGYSERGPVYVNNLRAIIRANGLAAFEEAKLEPQLPTQIANRPMR